MSKKLTRDFFQRDVVEVAPDLIGKILCRKYEDGSIQKVRILETEAYRGPNDLACHASKGRTERTEAFYMDGGHVYMFLCYGVHWMINFVTGHVDEPQAVLLRGVEGANGPGKLTKLLNLDKSFYGADLITSDKIWIEDDGVKLDYITGPRVNINYAGEPWISKPWRFLHKTK